MVTSKTFTGMLQAEVEAKTTPETSHLSAHLLNNNIHHNSRTLKKLHRNNHHNSHRNNQTRVRMMAKTSLGQRPKTSRLKIRRSPRRRTKKRCHLQTDHLLNRLLQKRRASRMPRSSVLLSKPHQKLPLQLQNLRSRRNSTQHQVARPSKRVLNVVRHHDQYPPRLSHPGVMTSASHPLPQPGKSRRL